MARYFLLLHHTDLPTYLMKKMFTSLPFLLLEVNKMEHGPTKPEYAKTFFLSDHKYVCASIQFNYGWSLKVYRKSCELMLRICCQQLSHSPFFLEKNPQKCEIDPDSSGLPNVHHCVR